MTDNAKACILIVENEALIASDLENKLKALGHVVSGKATTAQRALELVEQHKPDLVMMDIVLKGPMSGIEAAAIIRDKWAVPVVFLTAFEDSDRLGRAQLTYPFGYILKPFRDRDLEITIDMALYVAELDKERRKAEEALRESEREYRLLADNALDAIWTMNFDLEFTYINPACQAITGHTPEEWIGTRLQEHCDEENFEKMARVVFDEMSKGPESTGTVFEAVMFKKTGDPVWVEIHGKVIYDELGQPSALQGTTRDITERKHAEAALHHSQTMLERTELLANVGSWEWDIPTDTVTWSESLFRIFQLAPENGAPRWADQSGLFHPEDMELLKRAVEEAVSKGTAFKFELRVLRHDGQTRICLAHGFAEAGPDGQVVKLVGSLQDITERKQAEMALRENESRIRVILEKSPLGLVFFDSKGTVIDCNEKFVQLMGSSREKLIGFKPEQQTNPEILRSLKKALSGHTAFFEDEYTSVTGARILYLRVVFNPVNHGQNPTPVIASFEDVTERTLVLEALGESVALFRNVFEHHVAVKLLIDTETGLITDANLAAEDYYGWTKEELKRMRIQDINALTTEEMNKELEKAKALNRVNVEFRHRLADGSIRDVEVHSSKIKVRGKELLHSIVQDITERKRAEEALRESEEKHRRLFESLTQGVIYQRANGEIISANPAAERILGFTLDQLRGKTSRDFPQPAIREDGSPIADEELPNIVALRTGQPVERVIMGLMKPQNKGYTWISVTAIPIFKPGETKPFEVYATFDDITEQRQSEENFRTLFRKMLDGFALHEIICDQAGTPVDYRFLAVNPAFERMTGLNAEGLIGKTVLEVLPNIEPHWIETYGQVALSGQPVSFQNYSAELDKFFEVTAFRPATKQFACIFQDITDRTRAEQEKDALQAKLQQAQKMESVGTLAGGIAHDFNNLLQAITGYTQLLLLDKTEYDQEYPNLKAIQDAGTRAAGLVQQLLLFSRKADIAFKPVKLDREVKNACHMLERTIPKMIDIQVQTTGRPWLIMADPVQVEQIILNLGSNAADAMPEGGRLLIEIENVTVDAQFAETRLDLESGRYVLLTVTDTGHGMDRDTMDKIFEPFYTTKEIGKGTGLGLASIYGIVKSHNGHISCYSEVGRGTTFKIYLPAIKSSKAENSRRPMKTRPVGGAETVLIVDDEEAIGSFAKLVLERFGYTVLTASRGEEALDIFSARPGEIDLVIMDLGMPGMGGHKCLLELLRRDPKVKVVVASGYSINGQVKDTLEAGAKGYVGKPYQLNDLLEKVRKALDEES